MEEILKEITQTSIWLPDSFKQSNYYLEYLDKAFKDIKETINPTPKK